MRAPEMTGSRSAATSVPAVSSAATAKTTPTSGASAAARRKPSLSGGPQGTEAAKKAAAVVLEVLGGLRDTTSAGEALGVSLSRYYVLEERAIQGLVRALEPRPKGAVKSPEKALAEARKEVVRLGRELASAQALLRVSQRSLGIKAAAKRESRGRMGASPEKATRRRRRRTVRRAAQAISRLRSGLAPDAAAPSAAAPGAAGPGPVGAGSTGVAEARR